LLPKRQQLLRQLDPSPACFNDGLKVLVRRFTGFVVIQKHVGVAQDNLEHVVEVMGYPSDQSAKRFKLLGLEQMSLKPVSFLFGVLPSGNVQQ